MDTPDTSADDFGELGLAPAIAQAVSGLGYETPTAIQSQCIPHLLAGRDLLGQAQTGTGKTAAFALPLLSRIDPELRQPQVLVLTPTRELALQVAEAFQGYAQHLKGFHVLPIYGGQSYGLQLSQLRRNPQVIVGTPGRVMDHLRRGTLTLDSLRTLVLDEADEMLNMGFAEDIDWIFEQTPAERQVALFSATMPPAIRRVAQERLRDPVEIRVAAASETVDTIDQHHCIVTRFHKLDVLTRILEMEPFDGILIFVRTKNATTELADKLKAHGFAAEALNGDMNQELRERTVDRLKQGHLDILVATDVAARGLDVERLSHVINYDIPTDPSAYVHRIGRTGRAGRAGRAILLVEPRERGLLRAIERTIRRTVPPMEPPSAAALSASRIDRFTAGLREALTGQDLDFFYRLVARLSAEQELEMIDIAAALAYLHQRERPLDVKEELPRPARREHSDDRGGGPPWAGGGGREPRGARQERGRPGPRDERSHRPEREQHPGFRDERGPRPEREQHPGFRDERGPRPEREQPPGFRDERGPRPDRDQPPGFRDERGPRLERDGGRRATPGLVSYRIEVGHQNGATPREIVGAIANEAGLEGRYIGRIDIRDDHSIVDLPDGMPREIFNHLKRVFVCGQALRISLAEGSGPASRPPRPAWRETGEAGAQGAPARHRPRDDADRKRSGPARSDERPLKPGRAASRKTHD